MKLNYKWIVAAGIMLLSQNISAQQKALKGVVTEGGLPLPGVTVMIKGTDKGTQTDLNGNYTLNVQKGDVLVYSFVGMQEVTHKVGDAQVHNVTMSGDSSNELDAIVVTAYGTQTKASIAGSVGLVEAKEISKVVSPNVMQGMQGKVAGVQITSGNGMPGSAPTVRFRGVGSIYASAEPLYVVDGVPYNGSVSSISNEDIETITFLKDASAAALYGNRGANGVVVITTKKGKKGEFKATFSSKIGTTYISNDRYKTINDPGAYYEAYYAAYRNALMNGPKKLSFEDASRTSANELINGGEAGLVYNVYNVPDKELIDPLTGKLNPRAQLLYQDKWKDYLFTKGTFSQQHVNVSGGTDKSTGSLSLGYEKNDGYVINSGFERITGRLTMDTKLTDYFSFGGNMNYARINSSTPFGFDGGTAQANSFLWEQSIAPIYPVFMYDKDGKRMYGENGEVLYDDGQEYGRPYGSKQNPYATSLLNYRKNVNNNILANVYASIKLFDGLTFKYNITGDYNNSFNRQTNTPLLGDAQAFGGRVYNNTAITFAFTQQQLLQYTKTFGSHSIDVLLGHESMDRETDELLVHRTNMLFPDSPMVDHAGVIQDGSGGRKTYAIEGYLSRLNYNYDGKYYLSASFRRDASSYFHPDNRWGNFFGFGGAWILSRENFMKDVSWLDYLKLKTSYGEQGNDDLKLMNPYQDSWELVSSFDQTKPLAVNRVFKGNKEITWEKNRNFNVGFESAFFNNRLNLEVEYFERKVSDMLFMLPLSFITGATSMPANIGDMENKGFEFTVSGQAVRTEDFSLGINLNATTYKNKVTSLPRGESIVSGSYILEEGSSRYTFYLREFAGVNKENGNAQWIKVLEDGTETITENYVEATQKKVDKENLAKVYGGFGLDFRYKSFDLGMNFAYQFGGYGYDSGYMSKMAVSKGTSIHQDVNNAWSLDNKDSNLPRVDYDNPRYHYSASTLGLIKSDYLSLQNITLGYNFSPQILRTLRLDSLRLYASMDNVALWSKRKGYDPRTSLTGGTSYQYALYKTVAFGVNLQF
ncbi:TonB-dependent receptor [Myroides marinus]|uniref:SusC/RagA family TonB-linked outer membrane protein n=1 Tax=Myroides marinus TaxID=703342 RepID=UPI002575F814|nr:TonB-dependent receptor [Myroides marinus]MDM1368138.1 TonB-dependent receptor [Myroides marinus]MDM1372182.1 TonB-dependent receptor [Myroides marinus]MDM1375111.1 TonB-dependent receptor [Myroides marinus]MDM1383282.1 TonB-dependent receptor [Myroides marinus]MDM1389843.1 TonB-dependent receptor [Myroides marinus]